MISLAVTGILGGTFDPVHLGHLALALEAKERLNLDRVIFLPAGTPWQRSPEASPSDRLAMVRLAAGETPGLDVDDREIRRNRPTFTVETLQELRNELGKHHSIWLILGMDAFLNLTTWHRWKDLFDHTNLAVACRPGHILDSRSLDPFLKTRLTSLSEIMVCHPPAGSVVLMDIPPMDISASRIRSVLHAETTEAAQLIPRPVLEYIHAHRLYLQE